MSLGQLWNIDDRALVCGLNILIYLTLIAGIALLVSWLLGSAPVARYWCLCWSLFLMLFMATLAVFEPISGWSFFAVTFQEAPASATTNEAGLRKSADRTTHATLLDEHSHTSSPAPA